MAPVGGGRPSYCPWDAKFQSQSSSAFKLQTKILSLEMGEENPSNEKTDVWCLIYELWNFKHPSRPVLNCSGSVNHRGKYTHPLIQVHYSQTIGCFIGLWNAQGRSQQQLQERSQCKSKECSRVALARSLQKSVQMRKGSLLRGSSQGSSPEKAKACTVEIWSYPSRQMPQPAMKIERVKPVLQTKLSRLGITPEDREDGGDVGFLEGQRHQLESRRTRAAPSPTIRTSSYDILAVDCKEAQQEVAAGARHQSHGIHLQQQRYREQEGGFLLPGR